MRQGDWKLRWQIKPYGKSDWELFNLAKDPAERKDLAAERPDKLRQMIALWDRRGPYDTLEKDMQQRVTVYQGFPPLIYKRQFVPPKEMLADPKR